MTYSEALSEFISLWDTWIVSIFFFCYNRKASLGILTNTSQKNIHCCKCTGTHYHDSIVCDCALLFDLIVLFAQSLLLLLVVGLCVGGFRLVQHPRRIRCYFDVAMLCMYPALGAKRSNMLLMLFSAYAEWPASLEDMV